MNEVIVKTRCGGTTFVARAGSGKQAKTASSTSSEWRAAYAAARKYFGPGVSFGLSTPTGEKPISVRIATLGQGIVEIEFDDDGQDFWYWVVNRTTGVVIECGPFQAWAWVGCKLTNLDDLLCGKKFARFVTPQGVLHTLTHKVKVVEVVS